MSSLKTIFLIIISCGVGLFPAPLVAQGTLPALDPELQKFLNVPVWYLNYRIELIASGSGSMDMGVWNASTSRIFNGTMELGLRSQGPSFTMSELATSLTTPDAMDRMIAHYVNWMAGASYDDKKTDAENEADLMRALEASSKPMVSWHYSYYADGTCGPSHGQAGGTHEIMAAPTGSVNLEFDAEKKKYNFMFAPIFGDTEQSLGKVQGGYVINEGCESGEARYEIKDGFFPGNEERIDPASMTPPWDSGPGGSNIVRDLPAAFGPLSGTSNHNVKVDFHGELDGTYNITYTLSPYPPEPVELLIIPPQNYADWRPLAGKDEMTLGDYVPIEVKLQKPGGGDPRFKAIRFTYKLKNTSREKGICMNWPTTTHPDNPFDLQFEPDRNPDFQIQDPQTNQVAVHGVNEVTSDVVAVSSFDYGAYGELEIFAELENGQVVYGKVQGTGENVLKLPKRKGDSWIAEKFMKNLPPLDDRDDNEDDPMGDGYLGDGLSLYEEYRGFMDGDKWTPGDPKKKDVFVYNEIRGMKDVNHGISIFERETRLKVHRKIEKNQVRADMTINFYSNPRMHIIDQHVIRITALAFNPSSAAFVEEVGTPGTAKSVNMPLTWDTYRTAGGRRYFYFAATLAHEMLHDVNVNHHGESDKSVVWELVSTPPPARITEQEVQMNDATGRYDRIGARIDIIVKKEDGTIIAPQDVVGAGNTWRIISLGAQSGQHSGYEDCLMRYDISDAYASTSDPSVRYLPGGETTGMKLCTVKSGTGVNDPGHRPQSRYGPAATAGNGGPWVRMDRGDCKHMIRVNDLDVEPRR